LKHNLLISNDNRNIFKIETFGFIEGGIVDIKISDFVIQLSTKEKEAMREKESHQLNTTLSGASAHPRSPTTIVNVTNPANLSTIQTSVKVHQSPASYDSVVSNTNLTRTSSVRRLQLLPTTISQRRALVVDTADYKVGFVLRKSRSESAAQADLEKIVERNICLLSDLNEDDIVVDLSDSSLWKKHLITHEIDAQSAGLYSLIFARCHPSGPHYVSFHLQATFYNPGPDYLSAGDTPLPYVYFIFFVLFTAALVMWYWVLWRGKNSVFAIHQMMLVLLLLKCLSLFFESVRYHFISEFGVSEMWSAIYYIFAVLKGIMLFTVILLIGSGWSLMKSYLNDQEKRTVWIVLVLQVLNNVAMIVLEETAPGSQGWLTWRDLLHLVDIICCCAILLPIIWSIRHLRLAAEVDGKAQNSLVKLTLFREFYVMVVVYIYFTRIVVFLLAATIPYYLLWLGPCATETATLLFFVVTGYKFQPSLDNPYLPVSSEVLEAEEYGLEGEDNDGAHFPARRQKKTATF